MADFAADVGALLDGLAIDQATIGGLSMGGYVTLALFRAAPERFSGDHPCRHAPQADTDEGRDGPPQDARRRREGGPRPWSIRCCPKLLGDTSRRERPAVAAEVRRIATANPAFGIAGAIHA